MRRVVLALALGALLGAVLVLGIQAMAAEADEQARRQALDAARVAAESLLSYDHRTVEQDLAAAQSHATGPLRREYESATAELADQARAGEAVVSAGVVEASVVRGDQDEVVVLLFVDQTTTRKDLDEPRVDQTRLRLTLEPADGRWRVAELQRL